MATLMRKVSYCLSRLGQYDESLDACKQALILDPLSADLSNFVLFVIKIRINPTEAVSHLEGVSADERPDIFINAAYHSYEVSVT